jgi:formylglycine-generating enzyme required for sulfatase activity
VLASDNGFVGIPAGSFVMGNVIGDSDITDAPVTTVTVSAFMMDSNLVTGSQWQLVTGYAASNNLNYQFDNDGAYKALNHPVNQINWYDAVKWCNARSEMEKRTPVYYTDATFATVYRTTQLEPAVNWGANGYRLATEAEWEKAARGGLPGKRFPLGDTISESQANYALGSGESYDLGGVLTYATGGKPYTSPVGSFAANGYGLFDMAGNVGEWCWDWYGTYAGGSDPRGPATSSLRVWRGGNWNYYAIVPRCAWREHFIPTAADDRIGFRTVLGLGQ